jgi:hypothetical protein
MTTDFRHDLIKVLEIISYRLMEFEQSGVADICIFESDLEEAQISFFSCLSILIYLEHNHWVKIESAINPRDRVILPPDHPDYEDPPIKYVFSIMAPPNMKTKLLLEKFGVETGGIINFDTTKSILRIKNHRIKISRQKRITHEHKLLKYILIDNKDNKDKEFDYADIAEHEFGDHDYSDQENWWKRYHSVCHQINEKIYKDTDQQIDEFLIFSSNNGSVRINPKYL